jgi:Domain of unknown function (DUF5658)
MMSRVLEKSRKITSSELVEAQRAFQLGMLLCLLQAVDGFLTSLGISRFGIAMEGNPLLRELMICFGHIPALSFVKIFAIVSIISLTYSARKLPWINNAMGAISCVYIFAAIVPWTYFLFVKPYLF